MKKGILLIFLLVVVGMSVFAVYAKSKTIQAEREWKDAMMSGMLSMSATSEAEDKELEIRINLLDTQPRGVTQEEVIGLLNAKATEIISMLKSQVQTYNPTAYCVARQDAEQVRLDCRKLP